MKTIVKPLLMLGFVALMVFLMQQKIEEDKQLQEQREEVDPNSVIYSDIGIDGSTIELEVEDTKSESTLKSAEEDL